MSPPTSPKKRTGFTLLDDDSPTKETQPVAPKSPSLNMENDDVADKEEDLYTDALNQAAKWRSQLEGTRDELSILRIQNAIVMDSLTMVGADV